MLDVFLSMLRRLIARPRRSVRGRQAACRNAADDDAVASRRTPAVDLARLDELHDRGLLSDEEYVRQRMRALA
jgi:Short C-terminal domain